MVCVDISSDCSRWCLRWYEFLGAGDCVTSTQQHSCCRLHAFLFLLWVTESSCWAADHYLTVHRVRMKINLWRMAALILKMRDNRESLQSELPTLQTRIRQILTGTVMQMDPIFRHQLIIYPAETLGIMDVLWRPFNCNNSYSFFNLDLSVSADQATEGRLGPQPVVLDHTSGFEGLLFVDDDLLGVRQCHAFIMPSRKVEQDSTDCGATYDVTAAF